MRWTIYSGGLSVLLLLSLTACESTAPTAVANATDIPATSTEATSISTTLEATQPAAPQVTTLVVWIPDRLTPAEDQEVIELLNAQIAGFVASEENVEIELRRKRSQDVGGVLSTLRSASAVAPGALPDVTLIRREDLVAAEQSDLIQPLEGYVGSGIIGELNDNALQLGRINDQLFGVAYLLDVLLMAYNADDGSTTPNTWSYETFLEHDLRFAFPGGRPSGVSDIFWLQYLAAGGTLATDGTITLDADALLSTLQFYEQSRTQGLIDEHTLDYTLAAEYENQLVNGLLDAGIISSSAYQRLRTPEFYAASIPTETGSPITLMNGWMWVMVTNDTNQQALSSRFISWMMEINRQGTYAQAIGMLPSQADALRLYPLEGMDTALVDRLLNNAVIPLGDTSSSTVLRVMQTALVAVLNGESTAEEATRDALDQLSG